MTVVVTHASVRPYGLAFATPVETARGRFTHRRGWLLSLRDAAGRSGWGDAAPWPGFGSSDEQVAVELGALTDGRLEGLRLASAHEVGAEIARRRLAPEVAHALELALLDLLGQSTERSLAALLSEGADAPTRAVTHALVAGTVDPHTPWLKVKVGAARFEADEARLARVVAGARSDARLRVDAGGAWTLAQAAEAIPRLARYRVHTVEQPVAPGRLADLLALRKIANEHGIALAADEELSRGEHLDALLAAEAVDEVVLKPMFLGGLLRARRLAERALAAGVAVCITNALESAIGRAGARHLAATLPGVHGLSDVPAEDVASLPSRRAEHVALPGGHGLGIAPSAATTRREPHEIAIPNPLASSALARPDHPAVVTERETVSYRELALRAARGARVLSARGVEPGMTVALSGPRDLSWISWLHAIGWLGAVAAPLPDKVPEGELARLALVIRPHARVDSTERELGASPAEERAWPLAEPRLLVTSSGSTALPRVVELDTLQLTTSAFGSAVRLGHHLDDRWLACLPLHHVGGLSILYRAAFYGITVVFSERFDAGAVARAIDDGEVTLVSLVPAMLARVLDAREARWGEARPMPPTLRAILLGGAAAPAELSLRSRAIDAPIALTWGMSEAASQVATSLVGSTRLAPVPFARVSAEGGRLVVRGPIAPRGTLVTGDAGEVAADGAVTVHGRADDVIISGGEKVSPAEIESVLRRHPAVRDAAVVARDSARWGRRPFAVVETADLTPELLRGWCREHLAPFKVPDGIVCLPHLPRAALGKVLLREIHEILEARFSDELNGPQHERQSR